MPAAQSLRDLLRIRHQNRAYIDSINGNLGSALGFKKRSGEDISDEPAILIFVPHKVNSKWLPDSQVVRTTLEGPDGLTCPADVVEGSKYADTILWAHDPVEQSDYQQSWEDLRGGPPVEGPNLQLRERLRGWTDRIMPGCQLAGFDQQGNGYYGTLGCFAEDRNTGRRGFVTNQHVASHVGNNLLFPVHEGRQIGTVRRTVEFTADEDAFAGIVDELRAQVRVDCAFVELDPSIDDDDIDRRMPTAVAGGVEMVPLGDPLPFSFDSMSPVGQRIVGAGRTRSFQRGTITAFAYEYRDEADRSTYTDFLIVGDEGDEFSDRGDSGKLIVTEDGVRPVALLWGGWREQLRHGRQQENWTYAIDINYVCDLLGVDMLR